MIGRPSFIRLKSTYRLHGTHDCSMSFPNTCAIRMSEALVAAVSDMLAVFKNSGKNVCPHGYVRGPQDLASILASGAVFGRRDFGWERPGSAPAKINGVKGLVCYMNIPGYSGQGHVDLWDGQRPIGDDYWNASPIWMWRLQ